MPPIGGDCKPVLRQRGSDWSPHTEYAVHVLDRMGSLCRWEWQGRYMSEEQGLREDI